MRKRVGLARALAMSPEVLLYDEPTTGLDPIVSDVINELIIRTREAKRGDEHRRHARHEDRPKGGRPRRDAVSAQPAEADRFANHFRRHAAKRSCESKDKRVSQFVRGEAGERLMEMQEQAIS